MLKNAKNYEEEIKRALRETWYDPEYQYYHSDSYHTDVDLSDDSLYAFASVVNDRVIGFISYRINRDVNGVRQFGAISFDKGNPVFARDIAESIDDIFLKYHFNRMEWYCIVGNPVGDYYLKFIKEHGGTVMAQEHECVRTLDGELRDSIGFEILARNYVPTNVNCNRSNKSLADPVKSKLAEILAKKLNGRQYGAELTEDEEIWAKNNGLVVVCGASDDLMEFYGAINDEIDCYNGDTFAFTKDGFKTDANGSYVGNNIIKAIWCEYDNEYPKYHYTWRYETDIPHFCFDIIEDDEHDPYCQGIVFSVDDLR